MSSQPIYELPLVVRPSDSLASVMVEDLREIDSSGLCRDELLAFLEDYKGQLATVTPIHVQRPSRPARIVAAIYRAFVYTGQALVDLPDHNYDI